MIEAWFRRLRFGGLEGGALKSHIGLLYVKSTRYWGEVYGVKSSGLGIYTLYNQL